MFLFVVSCEIGVLSVTPIDLMPNFIIFGQSFKLDVKSLMNQPVTLLKTRKKMSAEIADI